MDYTDKYFNCIRDIQSYIAKNYCDMGQHALAIIDIIGNIGKDEKDGQ